MSEFSLQGHEFIELHSLLKCVGLCSSGGAATAVVAEGKVRVDGQEELRKRCKIRVGQVVELEGQRISVRE
jgi:ribosome-associated protein